jgi:hypothetical protein
MVLFAKCSQYPSMSPESIFYNTFLRTNHSHPVMFLTSFYSNDILILHSFFTILQFYYVRIIMPAWSANTKFPFVFFEPLSFSTKITYHSLSPIPNNLFKSSLKVLAPLLPTTRLLAITYHSPNYKRLVSDRLVLQLLMLFWILDRILYKV